MEINSPTSLTRPHPIRDGVADAVMDVVANPWTVGMFALVTTLGPLAMSQNRFQRIKGATCWVMRDGMRYTYYVGLGVTGAKAVHALANDNTYESAHAATLGGMLVTTKLAGDRYMGPLLESLGNRLLQWSPHMPSRLGDWMRVQGSALRDTAADRLASTGLALCAHSLDEIAAMTMAIKAAAKLITFRVPMPQQQAEISPWFIAGAAAIAGALALSDGPLPFGEMAAASFLGAVGVSL